LMSRDLRSSIGRTIRPSSSIFRTIPVDFTIFPSLKQNIRLHKYYTTAFYKCQQKTPNINFFCDIGKSLVL
jgi:hypothetical protein